MRRDRAKLVEEQVRAVYRLAEKMPGEDSQWRKQFVSVPVHVPSSCFYSEAIPVETGKLLFSDLGDSGADYASQEGGMRRIEIGAGYTQLILKQVEGRLRTDELIVPVWTKPKEERDLRDTGEAARELAGRAANITGRNTSTRELEHGVAIYCNGRGHLEILRGKRDDVRARFFPGTFPAEELIIMPGYPDFRYNPDEIAKIAGAASEIYGRL
jgi:hypothetical protein